MANTLTIYEGDKGDKGSAGLDGVGSDDVRASVIDNPLFSAFNPNNLSSTSLLWSRTASASITDRYGDLIFVGGDTISNILSWSEDFSQWSDAGAFWTIIDSAVPDPLGGTDAKRIRIDSDTFPAARNIMGLPYTVSDLVPHTISFWIRVFTGAIVNIGIQRKGDSTLNGLMSDTITSSYQRISITIPYTVATTDSFYIDVFALSGTEFDIFGAQLTADSQRVDYVKTTGSPVSGANPEPRQRANNFGYLIEAEKTNITKFSENLLGAAWTVSGGFITSYAGEDPKGATNSDIQVNFNTPNCVLANTGTYTQGESYSVSFWLFVTNGELSSVIASVGNGATVPLDDIPLGFTRVSIVCVAGSGNDLDITLTTGDLLSTAVVFGVQSEIGVVSSYISTIDEEASRTPDLVSVDYQSNFPLPSEAWTLIFTRNLLSERDDIRYLFHNGLAGNDEFSCFFSGEDIHIKNGATDSVFAFNSDKYELVFDGVNLSLYGDALFVGSSAVTGASAMPGTTMHLGSDDNQQNQLSAFISNLYFYDEALTVNELRYIRGSDS